MLGLVLIASLILHPSRISLVRLLEGYWDDSRIGRPLSALGKELHPRQRQRLQRLILVPKGVEEEECQLWAKDRLNQYPA
jgi:hypothetical protein